MYENQPVITGLGMISSVGMNASQTCASVRAGISRFEENEEYVCEPDELDWGDPEPFTGAEVLLPDLDFNSSRIHKLILTALQDLIQNTAITRDSLSSANVFIAIPPSDRTGKPAGFTKDTFGDILRSAFNSEIGDLRLFESDQNAFYDALEDAVQTLQRDHRKMCIVAGVDSYFDPDTLEWLDKAGRLKSSRNKYGFVPGEAAAAILIESRAIADQRAANVLAVLQGLGTGIEKNSIISDDQSSGKGLAQAIKTLIDSSAEPIQIEWVACDLNGEVYRAREWGFCQVLLHQSFSRLKHIWHHADSLGDVGVASGAVMVSLVAKAFERGYAPAEKCLIWGASDNGTRAALILHGNSTYSGK